MDKSLDIKLILIGVFVHFIIFYSIFDIYFKSPLLNGMKPVERLSEEPSPANRLVLIVADGLRSDSFFNLINSDESLFLR
jgi:GPI ethanolamine phosphate transferase 1